MKPLKFDEIINKDEGFDFDKAYKECFVDINTPVERPPVALGIGNHTYKDNTYLNPTFTYGELSAIVAPQRS
jgi:hypothetical protein